jgi:hypothetical protein
MLIDVDKNAINMADNQGLTPIALLAFFGEPDGVTTLVQSGADLNVKDARGTPLIIHAMGEREEYKYMKQYVALASTYQPDHFLTIMQTLIYGNIDLTATDRNGATALIALMRRETGSETDGQLSALTEEILERILADDLCNASAKRRKVAGTCPDTSTGTGTVSLSTDAATTGTGTLPMASMHTNGVGIGPAAGADIATSIPHFPGIFPLPANINIGIGTGTAIKRRPIRTGSYQYSDSDDSPISPPISPVSRRASMYSYDCWDSIMPVDRFSFSQHELPDYVLSSEPATHRETKEDVSDLDSDHESMVRWFI